MSTKADRKKVKCFVLVPKRRVFIRSDQKRIKINKPKVKALILSILKEEEKIGEISVMFVGDEEIKELNFKYRKKKKPTDVLAFPQDSPLIGDVVISIDTASRQAKMQHHSINDELSFLLIHGTLHLLGYDHHQDRERKIMFKKQDEYFQKLRNR